MQQKKKTTGVRAVVPRTAPKKENNIAATILMTTLAAGATGVVGYFGWQYYKKKKAAKTTPDASFVKQPDAVQPPAQDSIWNKNPLPNLTVLEDSIKTPPKSTPKKAKKAKVVTDSDTGSSESADDFPLKKGSKGEKVRALQQALIAKYGNTSLPKYGADGSFGNEVIAALKKAGLPSTVSETVYNVLVDGSAPDTGNTGKLLADAANKKNFAAALKLLKTLRSKDDYQTVGDQFKQIRVNGVRQTLVNGMLNTFKLASQKDKIHNEFIRMGLSYNGGKWSLDGIGIGSGIGSGSVGRTVVTVEPVTVWVNATRGFKVPSRVVLGREVARRLDYTLFMNNDKFFLVQTRCVRSM